MVAVTLPVGEYDSQVKQDSPVLPSMQCFGNRVLYAGCDLRPVHKHWVGGGNARNLEEAEVIWKELLSQEWMTAGPAVLFPEWKASIPTASFRSSPPKAPAMENCVLSGPALVTTLSLAGDLPSLSPSASPSHTVK